MADDKPLTDTETYDAIHAALLALGTAPGMTVAADTAITAARRSLVLLQMGLLKAGDDQVKDPEPSEP